MPVLREMPVLLGPWRDEPETLLLIGAPDAHGKVALRQWDARNWAASPATSSAPAKELLSRLEHEIAGGRSANQAAYAIREFLAATASS